MKLEVRPNDSFKFPQDENKKINISRSFHEVISKDSFKLLQEENKQINSIQSIEDKTHNNYNRFQEGGQEKPNSGEESKSNSFLLSQEEKGNQSSKEEIINNSFISTPDEDILFLIQSDQMEIPNINSQSGEQQYNNSQSSDQLLNNSQSKEQRYHLPDKNTKYLQNGNENNESQSQEWLNNNSNSQPYQQQRKNNNSQSQQGSNDNSQIHGQQISNDHSQINECLNHNNSCSESEINLSNSLYLLCGKKTKNNNFLLESKKPPDISYSSDQQEDEIFQNYQDENLNKINNSQNLDDFLSFLYEGLNINSKISLFSQQFEKSQKETSYDFNPKNSYKEDISTPIEKIPKYNNYLRNKKSLFILKKRGRRRKN